MSYSNKHYSDLLDIDQLDSLICVFEKHPGINSQHNTYLSKLLTQTTEFYYVSDIIEAINDIQNCCNITEHCIAFLIAEYGVNMHLKRIHKMIPTSLRTKFIRPNMTCVKHLINIYNHYIKKFCESFEIVKCYGNYSEDVNYPHTQNQIIETTDFGYSNTPESIKIHKDGFEIVKKDTGCIGGFVISGSTYIFRMCRYQTYQCYYCYCDSDN